MSASVAKRLGKLKSTFAPMLWRRGGMNSALRRPRGACRTRLSERGLQSAPRGGGNFNSFYGRKLATTVLALLMVTVHVVSETVSHPVQPLKMERKSGVAVRVTTVFRL